MHSKGYSGVLSLLPMERSRGGSSNPSYKEAVVSRCKLTMGNVKDSDEEGKINEKGSDGARFKKNSSTKDKEEEEKS